MSSFDPELVEAAFADWIRVSRKANEDWTHVTVADGTESEVCPKDPDDPSKGMWFRWRYTLRMPYEDAVTFLRPEAILAPENGAITSNYVTDPVMYKFLECGAVEWQYRTKPWFGSMLALLSGQIAAADDPFIADFSKELAWLLITGGFFMRRDFPTKDTTTIINVNYGGDTLGTRWWIQLRNPGQPCTCEVSEMFEIGTVPLTLCRSFIQLRSRMYPIAVPKSMVRCYEQFGYTILTLRKCCRGLPFLPYLSSEGSEDSIDNTFDSTWFDSLEWFPVKERETFTLSQYLRHIASLSRHTSAIAIHSSYDGRDLMWFQAAVRNADWLVLEPFLNPILKQQSSVYKYRKGGSGSPFIQANLPAKYAQSYTSEQLDPPEREDLRFVVKPQQEEKGMVVKNTFLHFLEEEY
mmetsp:Transcript_59482/g.126008  ORF Transcript_59482/g.126008 Transcript_59482/m.126008 type:complete len:408 (+) Transcript_59482:300-1523(+)|eukprot:CAMPEP_0206426924 /NCGR_PEP_ID=MMETSP0324_2-20121206/4708_1 /ASSEMBLY_ACC=CAM_ASM_000836 /TAXON_ID=2866 /ORGANISM="Crypthecodinium cohnii, Strain Seligo" /LENGTH=407 /DNA_ID=CAMNT_0053892053 /DNA_START=285 /DNA_END=1508 /DNA_ORIENTATION=+